MNKNKIIKDIFIILLVLYIFIFFASESGYYEYHVRKRTVLTSEKIKEFENDVKNNKNLDITDYLESTEKNYKNKLTSTCFNTSKKINTYFKRGVEGVFKIIDKLVSDDKYNK